MEEMTKTELIILYRALIDLKTLNVLYDESTVIKIMDKLEKQIQIKYYQ